MFLVAGCSRETQALDNQNSPRGSDALHQSERPVTSGSRSTSIRCTIDQVSRLAEVVEDQARSLTPPVRYGTTILKLCFSAVGPHVGIFPAQAVLGVGMTSDLVPCMEECVEVAPSISPHKAILDTEGEHRRRCPVLPEQAVRSLPMVCFDQENGRLRRRLTRAPCPGEGKHCPIRKHDGCVGLKTKV